MTRRAINQVCAGTWTSPETQAVLPPGVPEPGTICNGGSACTGTPTSAVRVDSDTPLRRPRYLQTGPRVLRSALHQRTVWSRQLQAAYNPTVPKALFRRQASASITAAAHALGYHRTVTSVNLRGCAVYGECVADSACITNGNAACQSGYHHVTSGTTDEMAAQ